MEPIYHGFWQTLNSTLCTADATPFTAQHTKLQHSDTALATTASQHLQSPRQDWQLPTSSPSEASGHHGNKGDYHVAPAVLEGPQVHTGVSHIHLHTDTCPATYHMRLG
eukprot:CAMPEP_0206289800 /NCGR_PEP_ID=MMETSP0106_2-20121207/2298_1 /ASSEMBLY_ACC=CAM_ASM_000206 /TAXON_ID=81532 /ORGANISM="Acanthoeca-like sp., Strain 10tr" /LENGTH=108 /DNA_ID=CAMNT_0053720355 /DNA_START=1505 /DNA_END=1831 /DNA_ORIENTATION=-